MKKKSIIEITQLLTEINNTVIPKIEILNNEYDYLLNNIRLSDAHLELLSLNKNNKCSKCNRDARYLHDNILLCWNHSIIL